MLCGRAVLVANCRAAAVASCLARALPALCVVLVRAVNCRPAHLRCPHASDDKMKTVAICYNRPCGSVSATALLTSKLWFAWIRAARWKLETPTIEIPVAVATCGRPQWQLSPCSAQVSRWSRAFECQTFLSGHAVLHATCNKDCVIAIFAGDLC